MTIAITIAATLRTGHLQGKRKQHDVNRIPTRSAGGDPPPARSVGGVRLQADRWGGWSGYARGGGGSGGTERNVIVEAESIDAVGIAAGAGAGVIDGMRPAAWNSDPRVANVSSALPIRQTLEPGADRWCIGQIAWSPCMQVHSAAVSSCAAVSSTIDGEISSAACITSQKAVRKTRACRIPAIQCSNVAPPE
jgi:hypothetical protein